MVNPNLTRNRGFISDKSQANLAKVTVAIAGVGGVGGRVATELTRLGVGKLKIADVDIFTPTNLNRQEGAYHSTLEREKIAVIQELCLDINPHIIIETYPKGVDSVNVHSFVAGANIVVEATDYALPHLGVMIARACRTANVPMVMGVEIGFGATIAWFKPKGYSYEKYLGLSESTTIEHLVSGHKKVDLKRWIPHVPHYGDKKVLERVAQGDIDVPAIAPAVSICAGMISTQVLALVVGSYSIPPAPAVFHFDAKEHRSRIIRWPIFHHHSSLIRMAITNALRLHDPIDF